MFAYLFFVKVSMPVTNLLHRSATQRNVDIGCLRRKRDHSVAATTHQEADVLSSGFIGCCGLKAVTWF
jgi:hypothetical protein